MSLPKPNPPVAIPISDEPPPVCIQTAKAATLGYRCESDKYYVPVEVSYDLENRLNAANERIGVCPVCHTEISHDGDEPFAYCECPGTIEWAFQDVTKEPLVVQLAYYQSGNHAKDKLIAILQAKLAAMTPIVECAARAAIRLRTQSFQKAAGDVLRMPDTLPQ